MNLTATIKRIIKRKLATAVLVTASLAAFATLGDGGKKGPSTETVLNRLNSRTFSLKTGYNYRANHVFTTEKPARFITLNTVVTYQKGNATYVLPLKKKVLLDKIKFNPSQRF